MPFEDKHPGSKLVHPLSAASRGHLECKRSLELRIPPCEQELRVGARS